MAKSNTSVDATFSGTRSIDILVVMIAGLFLANMIMKPSTAETETIQVYAAEIVQEARVLD